MSDLNRSADRADDLDTIVLIFAIKGGEEEFVHDFVAIPENSRYAFLPPDHVGDDDKSWQGGQSSVPQGPFFALRFEQNIFSPAGWIAGSDDSDDCDLRLAKDRTSGISGRHFRIDIDPIDRCPRITALSRNPIFVSNDSGRGVRLARSQFEIITAPSTIDMGVLQIRAWPPKLTSEGKRRYDDHVKRFRADVMGAQPVHPASRTAGTSDVKFALSGAVYKKVEGFSSGGSFGTVFKVHRVKTDKEFAAKVPHYKASDSPEVNWKRWEILRHEFENMVHLKHPHIVKAFEMIMGRDTEPPWLIMEWLPHDLRSLLPLQDDQHPIILGDISAGLDFMHEKGYAHRDLKPENILIAWDERLNRQVAKITDVGLSKYHAANPMHTFVGSVMYMAPEIWESEPQYTNGVDLWSLGVISLELLVDCGWTTEGPLRFQFHTWAKDVLRPRIKTAPKDYLPFVEGLLQDDPKKRWTAKEARAWLAEHVADENKTD